jgi:hypothetical protein
MVLFRTDHSIVHHFSSRRVYDRHQTYFELQTYFDTAHLFRDVIQFRDDRRILARVGYFEIIRNFETTPVFWLTITTHEGFTASLNQRAFLNLQFIQTCWFENQFIMCNVELVRLIRQCQPLKPQDLINYWLSSYSAVNILFNDINSHIFDIVKTISWAIGEGRNTHVSIELIMVTRHRWEIFVVEILCSSISKHSLYHLSRLKSLDSFQTVR